MYDFEIIILAQLESAVLDWLILFHSCFLGYIKERFNAGAEQEVENSTEVTLQKSPIKETPSTIQPSIDRRTKDNRFWIALGIIIFLLLAIIIKLRLQIEDRYIMQSDK